MRQPGEDRRSVVGRALLASAVVLFALAAGVAVDAIPVAPEAKRWASAALAAAGAVDGVVGLRFWSESRRGS
jgi:hypothetical protein